VFEGNGRCRHTRWATRQGEWTSIARLRNFIGTSLKTVLVGRILYSRRINMVQF